MSCANVFDIKRFGINDGAGIRTVLFLKGCPLRCKWCQNPEGLLPEIRLWYTPVACIGCKACLQACPAGALGWDEAGLTINHEACTRCGACIRACPTGALRFDARQMCVDDALAEIEKDRVFFESSGGGVTLSGGECTASPAFSLEVLGDCRESGIDTAMETCLHAPPATMDAFAKGCSRIIADLKLLDPMRHKQATGVDNALILENFERLAKSGVNLLIRIPLIPGYTADAENIRGLAAYIAGVNRDIPVELLNFNPMCREKYDAMRQAYALDATQQALPNEDVQRFRQWMVDAGLTVL